MNQFTVYDKIKKYIKLKLSYPTYTEVFKDLDDSQSDNARAILIGTPVHSNLGDHLIAEKSGDYLRNIGFNQVIEIPEFVYELFDDKIHINKKDFIFIVGGGWLGNLYEDQLVVEDILTRYQDNNIVILPQTLAFLDNGSYSSLNQFNSIIEKCRSIILCLREENSYLYAKQYLHLHENNIMLVPDMALLQLKNVKSHGVCKRIVFSMREDAEKDFHGFDVVELKKYYEKKGYTCESSSTVLDRKYVPYKERMEYIQQVITDYSKADLLITDRLHSMVFALCAGTRCLAFDNKTKKVSGVYKKWLSKEPGLLVINDEAMKSNDLNLEGILQTDEPSSIDFSDDFNLLDDRIRSMKNGK